MTKINKILVIQTAFIGDAILASSLLETIHVNYPMAEIDFVVRKGNESLYANHPFLSRIIVWDKKQGKYKQLIKCIKEIRQKKYDITVCLQRFFNAGLMTVFSKSNQKIGFKKSPLSFLFSQSVDHEIGNGKHEVERNYELIRGFCSEFVKQPKLYPNQENESNIQKYIGEEFVTIAPSSVWFTKQMPKNKWIEFCANSNKKVYILGAPNDVKLGDEIIKAAGNDKIENLSGKLSLLDSAALMKYAKMNFVNDSAPLHLCSSLNSPCTAIFCSTTPKFGFGPLSDNAIVVETSKELNCKPCGLHGKKACPQQHFDCGNTININELLARSK